MYLCVYVRTHVCVRMCAYAYVCVCMCTYVYVYVCVLCVRICMYNIPSKLSKTHAYSLGCMANEPQLRSCDYFVGSCPLSSSMIAHIYPIANNNIMHIQTFDYWAMANWQCTWTFSGSVVYVAYKNEYCSLLCFFFQIKLLGMEHNFDMVRRASRCKCMCAM